MKFQASCLIVLTLLGLICSNSFAGEWTESTHFSQDGSSNVTALTAWDDTHIWAGVSSNNIYFFDGSAWELQTSTWAGETRTITALCAQGDSDVWLSTRYGTHPNYRGSIYHFDGSSWSLSTEIETWLYSCWATSTSEVWVGGYFGYMFRTVDGGTNWTVYTNTGSETWGYLFGLDANHLWTVGGHNPSKIMFWDGSSWDIQTELYLNPDPASKYLRAIWANSDTEVWAAGDNGYILAYDGSEWSIATNTLYSSGSKAPVGGLDEEHVWAAPDNPDEQLYFWNGSAWSVDTTMGYFREPSILSSSGNTIWLGTSYAHIFSYTLPSPSPSPQPTATPTPHYVSQDWTLSTEIDGDTVQVLSAADDNDVWVPSTRSYTTSLGNIYHYNGVNWSNTTSAFAIETGQFRGVYALDSGHAWVTGEERSPTLGRIYGWNGSSWTLQTRCQNIYYIYDAYAPDTSNVWASCSGGAILRSINGGNDWSVETELGSYYVTSISGADSTHIWAVARWTNQSSCIFYYDTGTWTLDTTVVYGTASRYLRAVSANSQTDVWAVGDDGLILHRGESGQWELSEDVGDTSIIGCISARDTNNVWAGFGGDDSGIYYYDGNIWSKVENADGTCYSLDATAPSTAWAITSSNRVWRFDLPTPSPSPSPSPTASPIYVSQNWTLSTEINGDSTLRISAASDDNVWLPSTNKTSDGGNIYHFDGSNWSLETSTFTTETGQHRGVFAFDSDHAWVVGNGYLPGTSGRIFGYNGSIWSLQTNSYGNNQYIYDLYAGNENDAWSVGNQGSILRTSDGGATWISETSMGSLYLLGVDGVGTDDVWAVGYWPTQNAKIFHYNSGNWALETTVDLGEVGLGLRDVSAYSQTDVWAAGDNGVILHRGESEQWEVSEDVGNTSSQARIAARDPNHVWAGFGGDDRGLFYYDGTNWARVSDLNSTCYDLSVGAPYSVWAVTEGTDQVWRFVIPSPTPIGFKTPSPTPSSTPSIPPSSTPTPSTTPTCSPSPSTIPTVSPTPPQAIVGSIIYTGWINPGFLARLLRIEAYLTPAPIGIPVASFKQNVLKSWLEAGFDFQMPIDSGTYYISVFWDTDGSGHSYPTGCDPLRQGIGPLVVTGSDLTIPPITLEDQCASPTPIPSPSPKLPAVVGDYDGDGTADIAIWRPSVTLWKIRNLTRIYFGTSEDEPVPQDYNADGIWDLAFWRAPTSLWKIKDLTRIYFGTSSDIPIPADYDGDMTCDLAFHRASATLWKVKDLTRIYFGTSEDEPVVGDYSGDGAAEPAFWRASAGLWKMKDLTRIYFGTSEDNPIPGDYDGDGSLDPAFHRPASILWKVRDLTRIYFGDTSDLPIPADYNGDGTCEFGFFRAPSILWKIKDITRLYFGASDDIQVTNP